ncbi:unnamed protein product [Leuciscus chuanchicus]
MCYSVSSSLLNMQQRFTLSVQTQRLREVSWTLDSVAEDVEDSHAFEVAERELGIPALLDPDELMCVEEPDLLSIITYVSQLYCVFNGKPLGEHTLVSEKEVFEEQKELEERLLKLEKRGVQLEREMRRRTDEQDWSSDDRQREHQLMSHLLSIIQQRNDIISSLDLDRQREEEEDMMMSAVIQRTDLLAQTDKQLDKFNRKFKGLQMFKTSSFPAARGEDITSRMEGKKLPRGADRANMCDLRIVLLGKNGSKNSQVRNSILEIDLHEYEISTDSLQPCSIISGILKDRHITVINTLHLLNPNISDHQITHTVRECVSLSAPGPHAFILVLQHENFTEEDMRRVKYVLKQFSEEAFKRTIILTTDNEARSYWFMVKKNTAVHQLIEECGGGHLQLDEELQSEIFKRVDMIQEKSKEKYLRCVIYEDVKGTSVGAEQTRAEEGNEKSSHHKPHKKAEERQKNKNEDSSPRNSHTDPDPNPVS